MKKEVICHTCRGKKVYNLGKLNLRVYGKDKTKETLETSTFGT